MVCWAGMIVGSVFLLCFRRDNRKTEALYRTLGRTNAQVSALGIGGHHLDDLPSVDRAIRLVHEAIDVSVTFFDNCWEYYNGKTENILGRALRGRRNKVLLMTKVCTHGGGSHQRTQSRRRAQPFRREGGRRSTQTRSATASKWPRAPGNPIA